MRDEFVQVAVVAIMCNLAPIVQNFSTHTAQVGLCL